MQNLTVRTMMVLGRRRTACRLEKGNADGASLPSLSEIQMF